VIVRLVLVVAVAAVAAGITRDGRARLAAPSRPTGTILFERVGCTAAARDASPVCVDAVWTIELRTGIERRLAAGRSPAWSPDGRRIAFRAADRALWTMRPDGTGKRRASRVRVEFGNPSWSPDGRRIAFSAPGDRIVVVNANGRGRGSVVKASDWVSSLAWSPVEDQLAYSTVEVGDSVAEVYAVTVGEGTSRYLAEGSAPVWSPDGSQIAFEVGSQLLLGAHIGIDLLRADGTDRRTLALAEASDRSPAWAPNGREVAFVRNEYLLYRARDDGSHLHRVVDGAYADPAWSPDGTWIAYTGDDYALHVVRADGSSPQRVARRGAHPRWQPAVRR